MQKDIPERELFTGKGTGSACPLVWAHSEYIKLRRSLPDGKIFDQPAQTVERYLSEEILRIFQLALQQQNTHHALRKKAANPADAPATVHWSLDDWQTSRDDNSEESGWNLQYLDLPTEELPVGRQIVFTFFWKDTGQWEQQNFKVTIE